MASQHAGAEAAFTLVVPRLGELCAEARRLPPVLDRMLSRGEHATGTAPHPLAGLVPGTWPGESVLTRRHDAPGDLSGLWLRADPVRMVADINRVWVAPSFRPPESQTRQRLQEGLTELFEEQGIVFDWPAPERAYLRLSQAPEAEFEPVWRIGGRGLDEVLPDGPGAATWRRLINETQMLFHQLGTESDGPTSLWFWGPGRDRAAPSGHGFRGFCGDGPLVRGLADWLELPAVDAGRAPAAGLVAGWEPDARHTAEENLEALSETWLEPTWRGLGRFRPAAFRLVSNTGRVECRSLHRMRFWRRRGTGPVAARP